MTFLHYMHELQEAFRNSFRSSSHSGMTNYEKGRLDQQLQRMWYSIWLLWKMDGILIVHFGGQSWTSMWNLCKVPLRDDIKGRDVRLDNVLASDKSDPAPASSSGSTGGSSVSLDQLKKQVRQLEGKLKEKTDAVKGKDAKIARLSKGGGGGGNNRRRRNGNDNQKPTPPKVAPAAPAPAPAASALSAKAGTWARGAPPPKGRE